jgi:hypothetical protein
MPDLIMNEEVFFSLIIKCVANEFLRHRVLANLSLKQEQLAIELKNRKI